MPEITIDFSDAKGDEFSVIPVGEYDATVKQATVKKSTTDPNGATYIALRVAIDDGQPFAGATLFHNIMLDARRDKDNYEERALRALNRAMFVFRTMGIDIQPGTVTFETAPDGTLIKPNLVGKPVHVWVTHREWPEGSGQQQPNVNRLHGKTRPPKTSGSSSNGAEQATASAERRYV